MYFHAMSLSDTCVRAQPLSPREAEVLSRARHPGVVETVELPTGRSVRPVEGTALTDLVLSVEELAAVAIVVATTVSDLHHLGVTHGGPTTGDIIVRPDGRPILAGFSGGAVLEGPPTAWPSSEAVRADDRAVGALIVEMLERCAPPAVCVGIDAPSSVRTSIRRLLNRGLPDGPAGALLRWGVDAREGRVTTVRMADGIRKAVPGARLPGRSSRSPAASSDITPTNGRPHLRRPGYRQTVVIACGLAGLACLGLAVIDRPSRPRLTRAPLLPTPSAQDASLCLDPGSGCTVTGSFRDGVLSTPRGRFSVGRPGDVVAAGRWSCGRVSSIALLRPDRGEVWAFDQWPDASNPATAHLVGRVPQARTLTSTPAGSCDTLVVGRADGTTLSFERKAFG